MRLEPAVNLNGGDADALEGFLVVGGLQGEGFFGLGVGGLQVLGDDCAVGSRWHHDGKGEGVWASLPLLHCNS